MAEAYLGEDTFRAGMRLYAEQHKFSNSTTADLWAALGAASGKPVVALAAGWTEQPGFPVVLVSGDSASRMLKSRAASASASMTRTPRRCCGKFPSGSPTQPRSTPRP